MSRRIVPLVAFALLVSACSSGADSTADQAPPSSTTSSVAPTSVTDSEPATSQTSSAGEEPPAQEARPEPDPNRPLAPDFQLLLASGETYQLSADTKPVFMVFWAEW